jgi:RNA polymerase sigma-70 factor, ECF subfamily
MVNSSTDPIGGAAHERMLVSRAQAGDESAFQELFDTHKRRVYSLCLRMTGSTADAEDLTQETFLRVFRKIESFRGQSTFYTWLHRLAINLVLMHLRKKRLQSISLDEPQTSREQEPFTRDCAQNDLQLTRTAARIALNKAAAGLPRGYRTAFILHDVEGYNHDERARILNWSVGASKSQLHKARRSLRAQLRANHREPPRAMLTGADERLALQPAGWTGE